jgi:hypothetical protein
MNTITSVPDISSFLRSSLGETMSIRSAHGPGLFKLSLTGVLYTSSVQPVARPGCARPLKRYLLAQRHIKHGSVEFCAGDIECVCVEENTIYLKLR